MIKKLFLIRHGSAHEKEAHQKDFDRKLTSDGIRDSVLVGKYIFQHFKNPSIIISSSANRCAETASIIAEQLKFDTSKVDQRQDLYESSVRSLLQAVNELPEEADAVIIVAHNPSISYLADYLTEENVESMPPASLAVIEFQELEWAEVSEKNGDISLFLKPETLQKS
ncbi:MAG: histidine phosphatase family protein [Bacteroidota bacterium]